MTSRLFSPKEYFSTIVMFGRNETTYKIALAQALSQFVSNHKVKVSIDELAESFFNLYSERRKFRMSQINKINKQTEVDKILNQYYDEQSISYSEAIQKFKKNTFNDVIKRFHTVNNESIPIQFYDYDEKNNLYLTNELYQAFYEDNNSNLIHHIHARWNLLEASFFLQKANQTLLDDNKITLNNSEREIYLSSNNHYKMTITHNVPILDSYQKGICFYCAETLNSYETYIDHLLPQDIFNQYQNDLWNLISVHHECYLQKQNQLPHQKYLEKLMYRNECFFKSNHPIHTMLETELGDSLKIRKNKLNQLYDSCKNNYSIWQGIKNYNPETDPFYNRYIFQKINFKNMI